MFFSWRKTPNFKPTQNDTNNVSFIYQYMQHSELNGTKYCMNLSCSVFFSKIIVFLKFCQDLTYRKRDLQKSDSGTSQAQWHTKQTAQDFTVRTAHNPFSTVQLFHEYRLPEKAEILNICYMWATLCRKSPKLNSSSMVITWSAIGSWFSFLLREWLVRAYVLKTLN